MKLDAPTVAAAALCAALGVVLAAPSVLLAGLLADAVAVFL